MTETTLGHLVRQYLETDVAHGFAARILQAAPPRVEFEGDPALVGVPPKHPSERRSAHHRIGDADYVAAVVPELLLLAEPIRLLAARITGLPLVASPHLRSAVSVKVYEPGDEHGEHLDSNPISALLVLAGEVEGSHTVFNGTPVPSADGGLFIFDGKNTPHGVLPLAVGAPLRVTVPYNFYLPDDLERSAAMDDLVYGGEPEGLRLRYRTAAENGELANSYAGSAPAL